MAVTINGYTPRLEFLGRHEPYPRVPGLYCVGWFANRAEGAGDASGGAIDVNLTFLPTTRDLPYLPKLEAWVTILGLHIATDSAATMKATLQLRSDFIFSTAVDDAFMTLAQAALTDGGDGEFYWTTLGWDTWLARAAGVSRARLVTTFETNNNGKNYRMDMFGLLLKTETQLRAEQLWRGK